MPFDLIAKIVAFRVKENSIKLEHITSSKLKQKLTENLEVSKFLKDLYHPLKKEISHLRKIVLNANKDLTEIIK